MVTFRGDVYEVWADDLPKGRTADDAIDAARRRDDAEDEGPGRRPGNAGPAGAGDA